MVNKQVIIIIIIAVILIFVLWTIKKVIVDHQARKGARLENHETALEIEDLIKKGKGPTISNASAAIYANKLFTAMDGWGTDNSAVLSVFDNVRNDADVLLISKAWGKRTLGSGAWNPSPDSTNLTLSQALTEELGESYQVQLNNKLKSKGITYAI